MQYFKVQTLEAPGGSDIELFYCSVATLLYLSKMTI